MKKQRRVRIDLMSQAELKIFNAIREVESLGCDEGLTNAGILLEQALNKVGDYIDKQIDNLPE